MLSLSMLLLGAPAVILSSTTARAAPKKNPFGPFAAGKKRVVSRLGQKGKARAPHPMVGAADKVPGAGPPPPPLHLDSDVPEGALDHANSVGSSLSSNPLFLAALVYSNFLTRVDGPRCQHYPTCSRFASQAVAHDGLVGILMGLDRVIQQPMSSILRHLPEVEVYGQARHFDPISNYEFWKKDNFTGFPKAVPEEPLALNKSRTAKTKASQSAAGHPVAAPADPGETGGTAHKAVGAIAQLRSSK